MHAASASSGGYLEPSHGVQPKPIAERGGFAASIASAPRVALQRKQLYAAFGHAIQQQAGPEEEELLQAKFDPIQRQGPEEKELLQGKFAVVQRQGTEEELLQRKFDPVQRQAGPEEEELLQGKFESLQRQRFEKEKLLQGKFETAQRVEEEEPLQGKFAAAQRVDEEEPLQGKFASKSAAQLEQKSAAKPNDTSLPDGLKSGIESLSGISMGNVKVHYHSSQPAQLNALAYAQGSDIYVAPGQEQHLPHEAWHVVQRAQGRVKPTLQAKGVTINDDTALEHEADVMGAKALQMRRSNYVATGSAAQTATTMQREGEPTEASGVPKEAIGASGEKLRLNFVSIRVRVAPRSSPEPLQRMQIKFPPRLKILPIDTSHGDPKTLVKPLKGNRQALEIIRGSLSLKPVGLEDHEADMLLYVRSLLGLPSFSDEPVTVEREPEVQFGLPSSFLRKILSFLGSHELLEARLVSRQWFHAAMIQVRDRVPYPDKTIFSLLNHVVFPEEFAKGNFTRQAMSKVENLDYAWQQYRATIEGQNNLALVMRIFETETFRKMNKGESEKMETEQIIFKPATPAMWSPQIDDSWILAHIHKQNTLLIMCDPTNVDNFWDRKAKRLTATGREVLLALENGYKTFANTGEIEGIRGGLLLLPRGRSKKTGILPLTLEPQDVRSLLGSFPVRELFQGGELQVGEEEFQSQVSKEVDARIEEQSEAAKKNFNRLRQRWLNRDKAPEAYARQFNTCISMLTPDSHEIPYDRQGKFRDAMGEYLRGQTYLDGLGRKNKTKESEFKAVISEILRLAEEKSGNL
jgi:hypothetical protein